jgi:hypothetical protein
MRAWQPGGRFSADFETNEILSAIAEDLQRPVGTVCDWYVYDPVNTTIDPLYGVGSYDGGGRRWKGPYKLPVIKARWSQGGVPQDDAGFYSADDLHLTLDAEEIERVAPGVLNNPDIQNRGRIIWKGQVYRPYYVQQAGIVAERYTLVIVNCKQVMPEEMVNDPQFSQYASTVPDQLDL